MIIASVAGLAVISGLPEKTFCPDRYETFTVISALNVLAYYIGEWLFLRHHREGVFIPGWKFSAVMDHLFISLYGLIYLNEYLTSDSASLRNGLMLVWVILSVLLITDWIVSPKKHTHYRFILIALFLPVVYMIVSLLVGSFGPGMGINGRQWPYPFLNVDQLGWKMVLESCILNIILMFLLCWLAIRLDRRLGRRRRHRY